MSIGRYLDSGAIGNTRWDDLSISATQTRIGSNLKPDFDEVNIGLLFPQNNVNEIIYQTYQMSHRKRLGTAVRFHIHYIQSTVQQPIFTMQYRFYNNGQIVPSAWTTISTNDVGGGAGSFVYTSGSLLQICHFPSIQAPTLEGLSANLDIKLYRNDNVVTGDVLVKYIDVHYEIDTDGSREEFIK
jgi:hypothetical protein